MSDRIGSIAALMVAFVNLIPVIREQIPPNPKIVFIEVLVYIETFTCLLALIHSLLVKDEVGYSLTWQVSGLFLVSMIITILNIAIITVMMFLHYGVWERKYN